jgi:hypothetical protein
MEDKVILQIKVPRTSEETPENMVQMLASFTGLMTRIFYLHKRGVPLSLEIGYINQQIQFFMVIPKNYQAFIESQILSQYPRSLITKVPDYIPEIFKPEPASGAQVRFGRLMLKGPYYLPLKTFRDSKDIDPLSSVLGMMTKLNQGDTVLVQYLLVPTNSKWQSAAQHAVAPKKNADGTTSGPHPHASIVPTKIAEHGFRVGVRLIVKSQNSALYSQVAASFSVFNNASGNGLGSQRTYPWQTDRLYKAIISRSAKFVPKYQILNLSEVASLYHFPNLQLANIPNIIWTKVILSDPPDTLPVAPSMTGEEKSNVNFFAKTEFRNALSVFGIKRKDRRRHMYIIGKTGSGKSTLIANMVINDMRNGEGCAVIDPHGDLTEVILDYVPANRINDVIYLNPGDMGGTFSINPLESGTQHKDLIASSIVAIFKKLYIDSWGPRLEYILRNVILTLVEVPDSTLLMVPRILTDARFRARVVENYVSDPLIKAFWLNEYEKMPERNKQDAIGPILNKVGQFLSSNIIRGIVGQPKSTINFREAMDQKKIILFNLSQGKLGEDNAALLGAMTITKMQLAAMSRVDIAEEDREDFYLYVDEFQNFATSSFIKILSEARKYRLDLVLANQYTAQIPEELMAAIFGNVGTLMTFIVGAQDAEYLAKEYGERFKLEDLLALGNYQALLKLYIDGITTSPFMAYTLPLPRSANTNREKVIKVSNERYTKAFESKSYEEMDAEGGPDVSRKDDNRGAGDTRRYDGPRQDRRPDQGSRQHSDRPQYDRPQRSDRAQNERPFEKRDQQPMPSDSPQRHSGKNTHASQAPQQTNAQITPAAPQSAQTPSQQRNTNTDTVQAQQSAPVAKPPTHTSNTEREESKPDHEQRSPQQNNGQKQHSQPREGQSKQQGAKKQHDGQHQQPKHDNRPKQESTSQAQPATATQHQQIPETHPHQPEAPKPTGLTGGEFIIGKPEK